MLSLVQFLFFFHFPRNQENVVLETVCWFIFAAFSWLPNSGFFFPSGFRFRLWLFFGSYCWFLWKLM